MATMGTRDVTGKARPSAAPLGSPAMNLIVSPVEVQPVATLGFQSPPVGLPIMREGFVTETGFLLGSPKVGE